MNGMLWPLTEFSWPDKSVWPPKLTGWTNFFLKESNRQCRPIGNKLMLSIELFAAKKLRSIAKKNLKTSLILSSRSSSKQLKNCKVRTKSSRRMLCASSKSRQIWNSPWKKWLSSKWTNETASVKIICSTTLTQPYPKSWLEPQTRTKFWKWVVKLLRSSFWLTSRDEKLTSISQKTTGCKTMSDSIKIKWRSRRPDFVNCRQRQHRTKPKLRASRVVR